MTLQEMVRLTGISERELTEYKEKGLIPSGEDLDEQVIKDLGCIRTLKKFGMEEEQIIRYFSNLKEGRYTEAAVTLRAFRRGVQERMRECESALDILDCLIREVENRKQI